MVARPEVLPTPIQVSPHATMAAVRLQMLLAPTQTSQTEISQAHGAAKHHVKRLSRLERRAKIQYPSTDIKPLPTNDNASVACMETPVHQTPPSNSQAATTRTTRGVKGAGVKKPIVSTRRSTPLRAIKTAVRRALHTNEEDILESTEPHDMEKRPRDSTYLQALTDLLVKRGEHANKPATVGQPAVWATGRQELCETLPYYKSYHGGCYMNDGTVYSFMLDGAAQVREYMDQDVIICRAGGRMSSDGKGNMVQSSNHSIDDSQPRALLNNIAAQNPVIIICGDRNSASLTKMPQRFCVLGWFKPTHIWAELILGKGRHKFISVRYRFERLDQSTPAWYAPKQPLLTQEQEAMIPPHEEQECSGCGVSSPTAMTIGWMCLNAVCKYFWLRPNGQLASTDELQYHPAFLRHKTRWSCEKEPFSINPGIPVTGHHFGDNLQYINTRGVVCPDCGRCNQRYLFTGWKCDTKDCTWSLKPQHTVVSAQNLHHNPWDIVSDGPALTKSTTKPVVKVEVQFTHNYKVLKYSIPGVEGCIIHAKANQTVVEEYAGPDAMFRALQEDDIGLIRRAFGNKQQAEVGTIERADLTLRTPNIAVECAVGSHTPMEQYTEVAQEVIKMEEEVDDVNTMEEQIIHINEETGLHIDREQELAVEEKEELSIKNEEGEESSGARMQSFSMNFGMPYKFVAGGDSKPFTQSSWAIQACRSRLNWALRAFLGEDVDFNELLAIGYLEEQKINYHDDGETGLGPIVASLSLGAAATMSMRVKSKYFSGVSQVGLLTLEASLPLEVLQQSDPSRASRITQEQWQLRKQAVEEVEGMRANKWSARESTIKSKSLAAELRLRRRNAQSLMDLHLTHGDIVIMKGEAIQKYFEHAVEPHGSLRFAMTCRQILAHHLRPEDMPPYQVEADTFGYDGSQIKQAGDADKLEWSIND